MRILFISYYFEPFPGVGAKRISYWANNIEKYDIVPTVLTASEQPVKRENVHYIPLKKSKNPLGYFIKDPGLDWKSGLVEYFKNLSEFNFDFVLISGGPFMHFDISVYLNKKFNAKVILDFRDPFSHNPSFKDNGIKRAIKSYFERRFIKRATALIAVNKFCAQLIVSNNKKLHIIDNGFDESAFNSDYKKVENPIPVIAHAGTFISGVRSPELFLKTMYQSFDEKMEFHQFGKDSAYFDHYREKKNFDYRGMMKYQDLVKALEKVDICLLITEGKSFESTTKVFDYIGLNKKILIITGGEPRTGNLHNLTKDYPNVVWTKNSQIEIEKAIIEIQKMELKSFESYNYSRAYSLEKLVALLKTL